MSARPRSAPGSDSPDAAPAPPPDLSRYNESSDSEIRSDRWVRLLADRTPLSRYARNALVRIADDLWPKIIQGLRATWPDPMVQITTALQTYPELRDAFQALSKWPNEVPGNTRFCVEAIQDNRRPHLDAAPEEDGDPAPEEEDSDASPDVVNVVNVEEVEEEEAPGFLRLHKGGNFGIVTIQQYASPLDPRPTLVYLPSSNTTHHIQCLGPLAAVMFILTTSSNAKYARLALNMGLVVTIGSQKLNFANIHDGGNYQVILPNQQPPDNDLRFVQRPDRADPPYFYNFVFTTQRLSLFPKTTRSLESIFDFEIHAELHNQQNIIERPFKLITDPYVNAVFDDMKTKGLMVVGSGTGIDAKRSLVGFNLITGKLIPKVETGKLVRISMIPVAERRNIVRKKRGGIGWKAKRTGAGGDGSRPSNDGPSNVGGSGHLGPHGGGGGSGSGSSTSSSGGGGGGGGGGSGTSQQDVSAPQSHTQASNDGDVVMSDGDEDEEEEGEEGEMYRFMTPDDVMEYMIEMGRAGKNAFDIVLFGFHYFQDHPDVIRMKEEMLDEIRREESRVRYEVSSSDSSKRRKLTLPSPILPLPGDSAPSSKLPPTFRSLSPDIVINSIFAHLHACFKTDKVTNYYSRRLRVMELYGPEEQEEIELRMAWLLLCDEDRNNSSSSVLDHDLDREKFCGGWVRSEDGSFWRRMDRSPFSPPATPVEGELWSCLYRRNGNVRGRWWCASRDWSCNKPLFGYFVRDVLRSPWFLVRNVVFLGSPLVRLTNAISFHPNAIQSVCGPTGFSILLEMKEGAPLDNLVHFELNLENLTTSAIDERNQALLESGVLTARPSCPSLSITGLQGTMEESSRWKWSGSILRLQDRDLTCFLRSKAADSPYPLPPLVANKSTLECLQASFLENVRVLDLVVDQLKLNVSITLLPNVEILKVQSRGSMDPFLSSIFLPKIRALDLRYLPNKIAYPWVLYSASCRGARHLRLRGESSSLRIFPSELLQTIVSLQLDRSSVFGKVHW